MEQQVQGIQNVDKDPFTSNQQTVAHQPGKFILDFKNVYVQFTPDNKPVPVVNHRIILLDPYYTKDFLRVLKDNIEKYEKNFGEIKKPKELEIGEKEAKKLQEQSTTTTEKPPSYMG